MKKIVLAVALLSAPLLLTGCGNKKTLTCTETNDGATEKMVLNFKGDKLVGGKMTLEMDLSDQEDSVISLYKSMLSCDLYTKSSSDDADDMSKYIDKCTDKWDGKKFSMTITLKKTISEKSEYASIDEAKKSLEDEGATCTIK